MLATAWPFIEIDDRGRPRIQGTGIKVLLLMQQCQAWSWDAAQVRENYPQLSMAQIHAAFGYYHEHQDECDRMIAESEHFIEEMRAKTENPELQARLRQLKVEQ